LWPYQTLFWSTSAFEAFELVAADLLGTAPPDPGGSLFNGLHMKTLTWIALILLIVGGLNWLLVGAFNFDLVAAVFGDMSSLSRIVYILVGLAALCILFMSAKLTRSIDSRSATVSSRSAY